MAINFFPMKWILGCWSQAKPVQLQAGHANPIAYIVYYIGNGRIGVSDIIHNLHRKLALIGATKLLLSFSNAHFL
jgi:hypothetical protein